MFGLFLLFGLLRCSSLLKTIKPKQILTFHEDITEDKQYAELTLSRISQTPDLFYRIVPPKGATKSRKKAYDEDFEMTEQDTGDSEGLEFPLERNINERLEKKGLWTVEVFNRGEATEKFSISIHSVMKMNKGNEDVMALRSLLNQVQNAVDALGNENHYAQNVQAANLKSAMNMNFYLNLMCLLPFLIFLIAQLESSLARQLVRPRGQKFKWLFGGKK